MNAQQQAALAQAQAAKAKQAANAAPAQAQPTEAQKAQLKAYYEQQAMIQQQVENGIRNGLTIYNLDVARLNSCAQTLESAWKILNVEGNEEEVQKVVATTRVVYELIDGMVTNMAEQVAERKEQEAKAKLEAAKAQQLVDEEVARLTAEAAEKAAAEALETPPSEQPQNAPVVVTPATGEAPVAE